MNVETKTPLTTWQRIALFSLIILPIVGWMGVLDNFSTQYLKDSLAGAGLIYGTARGINALVSVLQGTEVNAVMMTFSIGEVLDPLNDLIERFSEVVMFALGSLALQAILLKLVSNSAFNVLLTILALATAFALVRKEYKYYPVLMRGFLIAAFLRFSLGLVVIANGWVDNAFLNSDDVQRHQQMTQFQTELREVKGMAEGNAESQENIQKTKADIAAKELEKSKISASIQEFQPGIEQAKDVLDQLRQENRLCALLVTSRTCSAPVLSAKEELSRLLANQSRLESNSDSIQDQIDEMRESINCMEKQSRGESCGILKTIEDTISPAALKKKLGHIEDRMGDFADNTINLLMSLLLKSVIIPLAFFYLLLKVVRISWSRLN